MIVNIVHISEYVVFSTIFGGIIIFTIASPLVLSDRPFQLLIITVVTYPIVFLVALWLSKFNPAFSYLTVINLIACLYILFFPLRPILLGIFTTSPEMVKTEERRISDLKTMSKDFVCENGTFLNLDSRMTINSTVNRPTIDGKIVKTISLVGTRQLRLSNGYDPWEIGRVVGDSSVLDGRQLQDAEVRQMVDTCKNSEGKTLLEVYPEDKTAEF